MKRSELEEIIQEELYKHLAELAILGEEEAMDERTVASREPPRKMSKTQIAARDSIGKKMKEKPSAVKYFKRKFGSDWEYYLWATATNKAMGD